MTINGLWPPIVATSSLQKTAPMDNDVALQATPTLRPALLATPILTWAGRRVVASIKIATTSNFNSVQRVALTINLFLVQLHLVKLRVGLKCNLNNDKIKMRIHFRRYDLERMAGTNFLLADSNSRVQLERSLFGSRHRN